MRHRHIAVFRNFRNYGYELAPSHQFSEIPKYRPDRGPVVGNHHLGIRLDNSAVPLESWRVVRDSGQEKLDFSTGEMRYGSPVTPKATLGDSEGAGDETVPARSAGAQSRSTSFRGVFQQQGYEHQLSYADENALSSTIYSITRIAQLMKWD